MPLTRLFHPDNDTYTEDALEIDRKAGHAIHLIVAECVEQGYSLRDVETILHGVVGLEISSAIIGRQVEHYRAGRAQAVGEEVV